MTRELGCRDIGIECPFVASGKSDKEVLKKASDHALKHHGVKKVTQDYLDSWKKKIHDR